MCAKADKHELNGRIKKKFLFVQETIFFTKIKKKIIQVRKAKKEILSD